MIKVVILTIKITTFIFVEIWFLTLLKVKIPGKNIGFQSEGNPG